MRNDQPLLLLKLLDQSDIRSVASLMLSRQVDLAELNNFLDQHRLGVFCYSRIIELQLQALFPASLLEPLEIQYSQQQQRNQALLNSLQLIDSRFRSAGIDYLLLKGLYLADRFWHNLDRRFCWDLDLMVRSEDVDRAVTVLSACRFAKPAYTFGLERTARRVTHALECKRDDGLSIDLHWTFRKWPGVRFDDNQIWHQCHNYRIAGGQAFPVPSDEQLLILMLVGIAADIERGHCRMRGLWDIYRMLQDISEIDWSAFLIKREAEGLLRLMVNVLALVLYQLGCHDEFPILVRAMNDYSDRLQIVNETEARELLTRPPQSLANRWWFARLQPAPIWLYGLWWTGTLPVRALLDRSNPWKR